MKSKFYLCVLHFSKVSTDKKSHSQGKDNEWNIYINVYISSETSENNMLQG